MTLALRPHHLLCILSYAGNGYSPRFIENFNAIVRRIERGERIRIVSGPDDICAPLQDQPDPHCKTASVRKRDLMAAQELAEQLDTSLEPGAEFYLSADQVRQLRNRFAKGQIRSACTGCEWHELCSTIATQEFASSHLHVKIC